MLPLVVQIKLPAKAGWNRIRQGSLAGCELDFV